MLMGLTIPMRRPQWIVNIHAIFFKKTSQKIRLDLIDEATEGLIELISQKVRP